MNPPELLFNLLQAQLPTSASDWLQQGIDRLNAPEGNRQLQRLFSSVPRWLPREPLIVEAAQQAALESEIGPINFQQWTKDQAGRVVLLAQFPYESAAASQTSLTDLLDTADLREHAAILLALPFLPFPEAYTDIAAEGIRTNMVSIFDAIALDNPYPARNLSESAWNQLYLKGAFMARPLYRIVEVDQRANADLSRMILDYVHERWSAGRLISPEIWRGILSEITDEHLVALERLAQSEEPLERAAAALVCRDGVHIKLKGLMDRYPNLQNPTHNSWEAIGEALDQRTPLAVQK